MARKAFPCGHKGRGQYCHRCVQEQRKQQEQEQVLQERQAWNELFKQDPIDLKILPARSLVEKARAIIEQIAQGAMYTAFKGKRMNHDRTVISIPLSRDYRLIYHETSTGYVPVSLMTHEAYNVKKPGEKF
ncbi:MAG TPA: hypothetical protein PLE42_07520 [Candidatus Competibacteraceae bacterium]|nr:MAG: hypothetical protein EKK69_12830 [Candidatus Competibacteraceae bacterium]HQC72553.1 hypothetical protein [Candidatus Competibacteraceae bacterium]